MITDKIMIMGAMKDVELNLILDNLTDVNVHEEMSCTFYEGKLFDKNIVVCHTNIGTINAAVATFAGIRKYNPTSIFVIGTAGAHREEIHRGDIVVATKIINLNSINYETKFFETSNDLLKMIKETEVTNVYNVYYGIVGSGDVWTKNPDKIKELNNQYSTLCEEMESAAIYEVSQKYDIPVVSIRVISNNEITGEEYDRETGEVAQKILLELLK